MDNTKYYAKVTSYTFAVKLYSSNITKNICGISALFKLFSAVAASFPFQTLAILIFHLSLTYQNVAYPRVA